MLATLCFMSVISFGAVADAPAFVSAQPVWFEGRETEKNVFGGFRAVFDAPEDQTATLRVTAATIYRAWINGDYLGCGPARGPHGYYRVDEWNLGPFLKANGNVVAIEVAGYNANSYYLLDQPSFVQAEVVADGAALAATGDAAKPFVGKALAERAEKVQRYSFQRPFIEVYTLTPSFADWRRDAGAPFETAALTACAPKALLARGVPYPFFGVIPAATLLAKGTVERSEAPKRPWKDRSLTDIGPKLGGYPENELDTTVSRDMQCLKNSALEKVDAPFDAALELSANSFAIVDFGQNLTGFPQLDVSCTQPSKLVFTFDEMLDDGDVNWRRLGCVNAVTYMLAPGTYSLEAFEPYTMRYGKAIVLEGACTVSRAGLRLYENPDTARAAFASADARLNLLFEAGRSTFAQNAVDIFMDCPHRERAGWLCDSYFTARSELALSGNCAVEHNFLENFLLPKSFAYLPEGMLPMCYPSDHNDGVFIPNWAMWFVMQLGEYKDRSGDAALVEALRPRVLALLDYFKKFENSDGLLEKLESWVFVEWSAANGYVQDVNYPSNMLYSGVLDTAARLYGLPELAAKAEAMRETIRKQSFDGQFFVDNAMRKDGALEVTRNRTEVCQYFAFYFNVATPETYPDLWKALRDDFGPDRKTTKKFEEIHLANSFIGNMLRMELLSRAGLGQQILDESVGYLLYMAERTGTLWENVSDGASLDHGFASHIVHTLQRDVLGVESIDLAAKKIVLRFSSVALPWCRGTIPVGDDSVTLSWAQDATTIRYQLALPEGFSVEVKNQSGKQAVQMQ